MGAIRVRGLINGKTYYGKVRRLLADGVGLWSDEFVVIPNGGLPPNAPKILGIIYGNEKMVIRLEAPEQITGYEVTLASGETIYIEKVNPGFIIVPKNSKSIATINSNSKSNVIGLK